MKMFFDTDETDVNLVTLDVTVPGTSKHLTSFSKTAEEYGESRIYAGFAFRYSVDAGNTMGKKVGQTVYENILREN